MIRWGGMEILETLDELVEPGHTALLLWDFDKSVVSNSFNYDSMIENTAKLLRAARERDVRVLYASKITCALWEIPVRRRSELE